MSEHENWQIRQACAHFLRCFQGVHKFLLSEEQADTVLSIAISLLSDERREGKDLSRGMTFGFPSQKAHVSLCFVFQSFYCGYIRSHRYTRNNATIRIRGACDEIH